MQINIAIDSRQADFNPADHVQPLVIPSRKKISSQEEKRESITRMAEFKYSRRASKRNIAP
jgi:hypothetical protein